MRFALTGEGLRCARAASWNQGRSAPGALAASARGGNMARVMVVCSLGSWAFLRPSAAGQPLQPGGRKLASETSRTFLSAEALWTARPPPANMAVFGAEPPSSSGETVRNAHHFIAAALDANREHESLDGSQVSLVRVFYAHGYAAPDLLNSQ
jgi:hypothetical protein